MVCACFGVYQLRNLMFLFTVVKTTVLLADINDFGAVNEVYKQCKLQCNINSKATCFIICIDLK
jgi:hypothetical protein